MKGGVKVNTWINADKAFKTYSDCFGYCNLFIKKTLSFSFLKVTTAWNKQTSWLHSMLQQANEHSDLLITIPTCSQFNTLADEKNNASSYLSFSYRIKGFSYF